MAVDQTGPAIDLPRRHVIGRDLRIRNGRAIGERIAGSGKRRRKRRRVEHQGGLRLASRGQSASAERERRAAGPFIGLQTLHPLDHLGAEGDIRLRALGRRIVGDT
ncbi:MAG: hypothetical protein JSW31_15175, partial [Burkholderiales bacterium]